MNIASRKDRNQGMASRLITHCVEEAREEGYGIHIIGLHLEDFNILHDKAKQKDL